MARSESRLMRRRAAEVARRGPCALCGWAGDQESGAPPGERGGGAVRGDECSMGGVRR
jgi:hypothetical protein